MKRENIDYGKEFDWGKASESYAKYRDIYPIEFYQRIIDLGYCKNGQTVLDLATGTGVLPRNMYKYGGKWTGVDIAENQIKYAKELSKGLDINYIVSPVEYLEFEENSFDVITACQCFMYFDKNILIPKIYKWLKPGGHLLIMFMVWLPFESEIAEKSEEVILKYNPSWTGKGATRYDIKTPDWLGNMFKVSNKIAFDTDVDFTRDSWHGRIKACRGIGTGALNDEEIVKWEIEHKAMLSLYPEKFTIPHYATILDLEKEITV